MTWDGDISRMGRLAENLGELAHVHSRVAKQVSSSIAELIDEEFQAEADPYGNAWAPHAEATIERWGEHPILDLTGAMRSSVSVQPMRSAGVSITIDATSESGAHLAAVHQTGWEGPQGKGPARPILPGGKMPDLWREAIDVAYDNAIRSTMSAR